MNKNELKYFKVYNYNDTFSRLNASFSSEEIAIEKLKKSEIMAFIIRNENEYSSIEGYKHRYLIRDGGIKDLNLQIDGDKIRYNCLLGFNVWNDVVHPEVKEEGKPYKAGFTEKTDESTVYIPVSGFVHCNWVTIKLDGVPTFRGEQTDE